MTREERIARSIQIDDRIQIHGVMSWCTKKERLALSDFEFKKSTKATSIGYKLPDD